MSILYKQNKLSIFLLAILMTLGVYTASARPRVSLVVATPIMEEPYTLYGHAGLRILDSETGRDRIFNWGVFDFEKPHFIWNFMMGHPEFLFSELPADFYVMDYLKRGSNLKELVINLDSIEAQRLDSLLGQNILPENRFYTYNFFYDNCSTRPYDILEKAMNAKFVLPKIENTSFRDLINKCEHPMPWLLFGTDLAVGAAADKPITSAQAMFLPEMLVQLLSKGKAVYPDGRSKPIILFANDYYSPIGEEAKADLNGNRMNGPIVLFFSLAVLGIIILWRVKASGYSGFWYSCAQTYTIAAETAAGIAGCILFFLAFVSEHPCMWPNANVFLLHPFYILFGLPLILWKKRGSFIERCYQFLIFVSLVAYIAASILLPQHMNIANFGIIVVIAIVAIYRIRISKFKYDEQAGEKTI